MRLFSRLAALFVVLWALYAAAPFVSLWRLADAVANRNVQEVSERVNFRATRASIAKQVLTTALEQPGRGAEARRSASGMAGIGVAALEPLLAELLTPERLITLLAGRWQEQGTAEATALAQGFDQASLGEAWRLYWRSESRGFRRFLVFVPPDAPPETRFRLELRLYKLFSWRLTGVDLPAELRLRLARELLRRMQVSEEAGGAGAILGTNPPVQPATPR